MRTERRRREDTGQQCRRLSENAERRDGAELEFESKIEFHEAEGECQYRRERAVRSKHDHDPARQALDVNADETRSVGRGALLCTTRISPL